MKNLVIVLAILLMASSAFANIEYKDNVGIYFDPYGDDMCEARIATDGGIGTRHVYLVLTQLTNPSVWGFELQIEMDGPLALMNYTYPAGSGGMNMVTPPSFMVGFADGLPAISGTCVVMEFDVAVYSLNETLWDTSGDAHLFVREIFFHSLEDPVPAYLTGEGEILPLHQSTGGAEDPVMIFSLDNGGCGNVVPADETTWDSLKSLYR